MYISYSSLTRYKECSEKYFLSKDYESIYIPAVFGYGNAIEDAVEAMFLGKTLEEAFVIFEKAWMSETLRDGSQRPILGNPLVQFLSSDYDKDLVELENDEDFLSLAEAIKNKENLDTEALLAYNTVMWTCCLERGKYLLKGFHDKFLPNFELYKRGDKIYVQTEIAIQNEEGDKIIGFADFVVRNKTTEELVILDLKTASKRYTDDQLIESDQLKTYVAALSSDLETTKAGYVVLVKKLLRNRACEKCGEPPTSALSKKCKKCGHNKFIVSSLDADVQFIYKDFDLTDLEGKLEDYSVSVQQIKNNVRTKNDKACYSYGRKCEFFDHCWNNKPLEEISELKAKKPLTENKESDKV